MNIEVKLKHFRETAIQQARALSEDLVESHQQDMASQETEHKLAKKKSADLTLKLESENARREASRVLATSQLELKHSISRKQLELKDQLFDEVKQLLAEFKKSPDYEFYLLKKIHEAVEFAGEDTLHIYLTREDADMLDTLKEKSGFPLEVSVDSFDGGIFATIPEKNILINNTFKDSLKAVYKEFTFHGGASL